MLEVVVPLNALSMQVRQRQNCIVALLLSIQHAGRKLFINLNRYLVCSSKIMERKEGTNIQ